MHILLKATMCDGTDHGQPTVCGHGTPNEMVERRFSAASEIPHACLPTYLIIKWAREGKRENERERGGGMVGRSDGGDEEKKKECSQGGR